MNHLLVLQRVVGNKVDFCTINTDFYYNAVVLFFSTKSSFVIYHTFSMTETVTEVPSMLVILAGL